MGKTIIDNTLKLPSTLSDMIQGIGNFFIGTGDVALHVGADFQQAIGATGDTFAERAGGLVNKAKDVASNFIASAPGTKLIAGVDVNSAFNTPTKEIQIAQERAVIQKQLLSKGLSFEEATRRSKIAITPSQVEQSITTTLGFFGNEGGMIKNVIKDLANTTNKTVVKIILQNNIKNITAKEADTLAIKIAPLTDTIAIGNELKSFASEKIATVPIKERGFVTSVKEAFPDVSSKVAGQYIPRSTDELAIKAQNLIRDDFQQAEKIVATGSDDSAVATASELIKFYGDAAANAVDTATKAAFEQKMADIANPMAQKLTELGRSVQAASILGRLTPEGQVRFAAREIQKYNEAVRASKSPFAKEIPELTGEQAGKIVEQMKLIADMPDGIAKAQAFQKVQDGVLNLVPSPLLKKITTVWRAGLLTGIKTTGLNIYANVSHFLTETIKDVPATAVDSVASLLTGERTKTFTLRGKKSGFLEGFQKGWDYLKTGFDERNIMEKLDYKKVNFGTSAFARGIQKYEETVFKILGAEDQPFYYSVKAGSLYDQAFAQGKNLDLAGNDLINFANNLVKNPTDDMLKYASIDAETAVFQNKTILNEAARSIQNLGKGTSIEGIGEFVVPFSRTPSAVATQIINYSPIGIVKTIVENIGKGKFDQRLFSQGIGRGLTGTAFLYIGTKLFDNDLITLNYPTEEREQKLWELEGRKPNSIKIGDKWRTAQTLGPVGSLLIIGAYFKKSLKETGSITQAITQSLAGGLKSFTEQTFLQGLRNVTDAINDPERFADAYFGNLIASFVPTLSSDVARASDLTERRSRTVLERVEARIPFIRESLQPKVDVLGRERSIGGNVMETLLDPTRPSKDISTPLIKELRRLSYAGFNVSPTLLGNKDGFSSLTPEQNIKLWERTGEIIANKLGNLISNPVYTVLPIDQKAKTVDDFINKSKVIARAERMLELTIGLTGDVLKKELSKQKQGKLMTREVYNKYLELR